MRGATSRRSAAQSVPLELARKYRLRATTVVSNVTEHARPRHASMRSDVKSDPLNECAPMYTTAGSDRRNTKTSPSVLLASSASVA